jgi:hypothetical protein
MCAMHVYARFGASVFSLHLLMKHFFIILVHLFLDAFAYRFFIGKTLHLPSVFMITMTWTAHTFHIIRKQHFMKKNSTECTTFLSNSTFLKIIIESSIFFINRFYSSTK